MSDDAIRTQLWAAILTGYTTKGSLPSINDDYYLEEAEKLVNEVMDRIRHPKSLDTIKSILD